MAERRISIDRIAVRLRGLPVSTGRAVADGLPQAIARALPQQGDVTAARGSSTDGLDLGRLPVARERSGNAIAGTVAQAIASRLKGGAG